MKKIIGSVSILILLLSSRLSAQQDSLVIYDLSAIMTMGNSQSVNSPAPDSISVSTFFKVNQPGAVQEVYILIGQNQNTYECVAETLTVSLQNGNYHVKKNNQATQHFKDKATSCLVKFPISQLQNAKWMTVYGKRANGSYSAKKYFKIQ